MPLNINRFVRITSGVGGASGVQTRDLIGRLFTPNVRVSVAEVLEFSDAPSVGQFFGSASPEYARAAFYFGFVSKSLSAPRKLSFARYSPTAEPGRVFGAPVGSLSDLQQVTAGAFSITVGAETATVDTLDLSAAASFAAAAALIQTAIQAAPGAAFASATVAYDAASRGFDLVLSDPGPGVIELDGPTLVDLGWATGAVVSEGTAAQSVSDALTAANQVSNNAGSLAFVPALSDAEAVEFAQWVGSLNVEYIACIRANEVNFVSLAAALTGVGGVALTFAPVASEFDEMAPMAILAATDYSRPGSSQNYMFQQLALSPKVSGDAQADAFDAARVNYYGQTQTAGQRLSFYMRGVLQGTLTDPRDMNTYANEIWFKDSARAALMGLLLGVGRVPANEEGRLSVRAVLQGPIDQARSNGTISPGKTLDATQKAHIASVTNDPDAWREVQGIGYWCDAVVVRNGEDYRIDYVLVYSKDDAIREIRGTHDLI